MSEIDISTVALEGAFTHLECCDCSDEAVLFRAVAADRALPLETEP